MITNTLNDGQKFQETGVGIKPYPQRPQCQKQNPTPEALLKTSIPPLHTRLNPMRAIPTLMAPLIPSNLIRIPPTHKRSIRLLKIPMWTPMMP